MKKTSTILAVGSGLFLSNAQAEIESEFHVGYNSQYIFRGVDLGDDAYEYGLNFAGTSDLGLDWSAGIWGISPDQEDGSLDELDIYAAVSKDLKNVTLSAGFTAYTYDFQDTDSEIFLAVSGSVADFDAGLTVFFGTDGNFQEQVLLEANLSYAIELSETVSANIALTYGHILDNGRGGYAASDGAAYFSASVGLDIILSEDITLSPYLSYVDGNNRLDTSSFISDVNVANQEVFGGAKITYSF